MLCLSSYVQTESFFPSLLSSCVVGWVTKGQDLYNSKSVRDKQIVRIIGKVREFLLSLFFPPKGDLLLSVYIARLLRIPHLLPFKCFRLSFWVQSWMFSNCAIFGIRFQVPTLAAAAYLRMAGRPPVLPSNQLSYSENFLYMLDSL